MSRPSGASWPRRGSLHAPRPGTLVRLVRRSAELLSSEGLSGYARYLLKKWRTRVLGYPSTVLFEVASHCNYRCPMCWAQRAGPGRRPLMPFEEYTRVIDDLAPFCLQVHLSLGGETLLHPELPRLIRYASRRHLETVISTNGQRLDEACALALVDSGLSKIVVSLDAVDPATHAHLRVGGDFAAVTRNVRFLTAQKRQRGQATPWVELQMVCTRRNEDDVEAFLDLAADLGVDQGTVKTLYIDTHGGEGFRTEMLDMLPRSGPTRYTTDGEGRLRLRELGACPSRNIAVVMSTGDVILCCYDTFGARSFGNATTESFRRIWRAKDYRKYRSEVMDNRSLEMCKTCNYEGAPSIQVRFADSDAS